MDTSGYGNHSDSYMKFGLKDLKAQIYISMFKFLTYDEMIIQQAWDQKVAECKNFTFNFQMSSYV